MSHDDENRPERSIPAKTCSACGAVYAGVASCPHCGGKLNPIFEVLYNTALLTCSWSLFLGFTAFVFDYASDAQLQSGRGIPYVMQVGAVAGATIGIATAILEVVKRRLRGASGYRAIIAFAVDSLPFFGFAALLVVWSFEYDGWVRKSGVIIVAVALVVLGIVEGSAEVRTEKKDDRSSSQEPVPPIWREYLNRTIHVVAAALHWRLG